jgi:hypothetical protein
MTVIESVRPIAPLVQPPGWCPGCSTRQQPETMRLVRLNPPFVDWRCPRCQEMLERSNRKRRKT